MSPSSLIFVAVVAIWAAYLVIDTSRRREYLATARSVDRFSASMRVLQRRAVRRESAEAFEASSAPMRSTSSVLLHRRPEQVSRAAVEARAAEAAARPVVPVRSGGTSGLAARQRTAARVRRARMLAVVALGFAVTALITGVLAGLALVSWVVPFVGLLASVTLVALLRRQAVASRGHRSRPAVGRAASATRDAARQPAEVAAAAASVETSERTPDLRPAASVMPVAQQYVPFDYAREVEPSIAAEYAYAERVAARANEDLLLGPDGWAPVPVPPPTYTLKARAERPLPPPLEIYDDTPVPVMDEWDDLDELAYGRASGQ